MAASETKANAAQMPSNGGPALQPKRSVAVLGFRNLSVAASAWLSTAWPRCSAVNWGGRTLRIVPGENVDRMKVELALAEAESYAPSTLARIQANQRRYSRVRVLPTSRYGGSKRSESISGSGRRLDDVARWSRPAMKLAFDLVLRCGDGLRRG
jgi:hypothetical protein